MLFPAPREPYSICVQLPRELDRYVLLSLLLVQLVQFVHRTHSATEQTRNSDVTM